MREISPTRSAYLELREERVGMEEGYHFLDEKRMVLAAEMLNELRRYETAIQTFQQAYQRAASLLKNAIGRHGLNGLEIYPVKKNIWSDISKKSQSVLGLVVNEFNIKENVTDSEQHAINYSPEAELTRKAFTSLISMMVELSGMRSNLFRLQDEYQRTSRRARALEDVILPEIDEALSHIDATLEEMDKEEIVRIRFGLQSQT